MKMLALCLMLGVVPGFSDSRQEPVAPILIYTQYSPEASATVIQSLQDEVADIMSPIGFRLEWRSLAVHQNESAVELAVVTFKGRCNINGMLPLSVNPGALGWTHVSDGVILPFSDVDCDRVRGFLQRELLLIPPDQREEVYGRALGRVLAHELFHIFANTPHHGADGVGKAAYSVKELVAEDFQFEEKESVALRTSKASVALHNAGATNPDY